MATTEEIILHYQRDIEKILSHPERVKKYQDRLLHCLNKLRKLPVTVSHLHATGVGKTVNSFRKIEAREDVNVAAKALVAKWKSMVIEEEEEEAGETENNEDKESKPQNVKRIKTERDVNDKSNAKDYGYRPSRGADYSPTKISRNEDEYEPVATSISNGIKVLCYSPSKKVDDKKKTEPEKKEKKSDTKKSSHREHGKRERSKSSSSKQPSNGVNFNSGASFEEALGFGAVNKASNSSSVAKSLKSTQSLRKTTKNSTEVPAKTILNDVAGPSHLAPLDLDVVSTLSVPTPHYKPMPQPPPSLAERKQRSQLEEDALARIMSNKNKVSRTKVYSGVKGIKSNVLSLYNICVNMLKQHIDALEYTGGIPFSLLSPVLEGASPTQLYQFENYNPYVIGETDDLWKFHCQRQFRGATREEMETWRDMYLRCLDEREIKYKGVTANIRESLKKSVPVRQTKLAYVDIKPSRSQKLSKHGSKKPQSEKLMGKGLPGVVEIRPASMERPKISSIFKPKVAPLMQKTLKSIRQTRFKR